MEKFRAGTGNARADLKMAGRCFVSPCQGWTSQKFRLSQPVRAILALNLGDNIEHDGMANSPTVLALNPCWGVFILSYGSSTNHSSLDGSE